MAHALMGIAAQYWDEAVIFLLPLIFGAGFYQTQRGAWIKKTIDALAGAVVEKNEATMVVPIKAASGLPKLTPPEQVRVKNSAVADVVGALRPILGPVSTEYVTAIGDAIEAIISRSHKRLPEASMRRFGIFRRR